MINWITGGPSQYKYNGNGEFRIGWFDSVMGDKRQLLNCGPFSMNSGSEQFLVTGSVISRGSYNYNAIGVILNASDNAKNFYNSSFGGTPIGINSISTELPQSFSLEQNYPNPFNPVTKFKFSIPVAGSVSLKIYDISGREVAEILNKPMQPGTYEADWDASAFSSGVYFYSIQAGEFNSTKKMVLVK